MSEEEASKNEKFSDRIPSPTPRELTNTDDLTSFEPVLKKNFGLRAILGTAFSLTNSWFGISASLSTGISSGGPLIIVYGIIVIAVVSTCIGITLSELASAYPNAGGQFYWTVKLAPRKYSRFLSYLTGSLAWVGSIFTSASVTISIAQFIVGFWGMTHPSYEYQRWQVFVIFQILNFLIFWFNYFGKILPAVSQASFYISLTSFVVISITVLACSSGDYNSSSFVFTDFSNGTGWNSFGMAFILGLINPNWSFSCLDSATHMAEEALQPERVIPITIMATVAIGFVTSFCYVIAMFYSIKNLDAVLADVNSPIIQIYYQSIGNKGGAIFLGVLLFVTGVGCNVACHTWQARLCWSFARDDGIPFSKYWKRIDPKSNLPVNAHFMSTVLCALVGCLYLASYTAYNSLVVGCITFLLLSYMIPVCCLLWYGRSNIKHGPFWLGKIGFVCNVITILWALFATVIYSFPFTLPAEASNMNYMSVVLVFFTLYFLIYWWVEAKEKFCKDIEKYYYDENE
ncbi:Hnm1 protein [Saccharomycopsis crataegensis]|uniref:Hnm1 protein n=1 Tax=Saccharomycopsis crataegensis TaxID=43959 RepID=A0AAV5QS65_9ASCO|nr:Hnm1 protein [Saccharomycopsis crataegensis]